MLRIVLFVSALVVFPPYVDARGPVADGEVFAVLELDELLDALPPDGFDGPFSDVDVWPHVVLDGPGEVVLGGIRRPQPDRGAEEALEFVNQRNLDPFWAVRVAIRAPAGQGVTGRMQFRGTSGEPGVVMTFALDADAFDADEAAYQVVQRAHYERLLKAGLPGAAWFRHRADAGVMPADANPTRWGRDRPSTLEDSFELFTGGRAVSENLALDRTLPVTIAGEDTVPVANVQGIRTPEYDWATLVDGLSPELDPLASAIPEDQHALFFPDFEALIAVADHAEVHGAPVLAALEPRSETAHTRRRYEQQLGLPMSVVSRMLGPLVVESVAITGSDPYLRTGSDVALLFEGDATILGPLLIGRVMLAAQGVAGATTVDEQRGGVRYAGVTTPDRSLCSYVASLGEDAVVVTNSLAQLDRLSAVARGDVPALASLDEYVFFRDRYPRGDAAESALLVVSDATIRRWCGPRWRIGSSRRSRAASVLAEWQARSVDALLAGDGTAGPLEPDDTLLDVGALSLDAGGARSEIFGSLGFSTPIVELDLDLVTEAEEDLYLRWRRGYESNWQEFFDPIALRCTVDAEQLAIDLTVRPLIAGTDYQEFIATAAGETLGPCSGDPHEGALVHWVTAFDRDAASLRSNEILGMARMLMPKADPLGWMGSAYGVYADADPFWTDLATARAPEGADAWDDDLDDFWMQNLYCLPVALHADVGDAMQLTFFLAAARAFIQQSAPDMLAWENREHAGRSYVRVAPTEMALEDFMLVEEREMTPPALHYVASGQGLTLSLSESVIQRALERQVARAERHAEGGDLPHDAAPAWLGQQLGLRVDRDVVSLIESGLTTHDVQPLQAIAWSNLPILDEWKRRWPDRDPLAVHQQLWGRQLLCPAGGGYRWNDEDDRMESTHYGHPGRPKRGPVLPVTVKDIGSAEFGLDFEDDGLRARARLFRN